MGGLELRYFFWGAEFNHCTTPPAWEHLGIWAGASFASAFS